MMHLCLVELKTTPSISLVMLKIPALLVVLVTDSLVVTDFVRGSPSMEDHHSMVQVHWMELITSVLVALSSSAVYGNSGADSLLIGNNATASSIYGGSDNDLVSVSGDVSAGQIFGGSGVDTVIITGSLVGGCHSQA